MKKPSKADLKFAADMIEHHKAALEMAMDRISGSDNSFITHFSSRVLSAQSSEIEELRGWLLMHSTDSESPDM